MIFRSDEASVKANAAAEALRKQMQAEIVAALGETRAKEVERNDDYEFQQLRRLATRSELPADTAMKVYDLKEATEASTEKFEQNDQLTDEQRAAARKAIYAEAEKATQTLLGETAFKKYLSNPGVWLRNHN